MLLTYPQLRDESAVDALCEMLRDKYPSVRTVAARALSGIPRARAAEPLLQALEAERNPKVIAYMVGALASIGDARAIEPIETLLSLWVIEERGSPWIIRDFERALERALERLKNPQRHP